jgi:hypothetical protein
MDGSTKKVGGGNMIKPSVLPDNGSTFDAKPNEHTGTRQEALPPSYGFFQAKQEKAAAIVDRLVSAACKVRFGSAAVILKIHDGRIVDVTHTVTESTREREGTHEA